MSRYIDVDKAIDAISTYKGQRCYEDRDMYIKRVLNELPSADVVEVGIITCLGIKFVVEDDIIKVKWRHGDKHYIVPFGGLLDLWEKYKEQNHESNS